MPRYVALLRGINVGGKNVIRMADLRACFEEAGYGEVATYIQSGNVAFTAAERSGARLTAALQKLLAGAFDYDAALVLRSKAQVERVIREAPRGFGGTPDAYRYDVAFLMPPLTAKQVLADLELRDGVDRAWPGSGVLYFSRLIARAAQSRFSKLASLPIYQRMTVRNWNTTRKLLALVDPA